MGWVFKISDDIKSEKNLTKLREIFQRDIEHLIWVFSEHIRDDWFPRIGNHLDWGVLIPYDGKFVLTRIAKAPDNMYRSSNEKHNLLFQLSLHKDSDGQCNFPRNHVIHIADSVGREVDAFIFPDFSSLPDGYMGEMSDVRAFKRRSDIYGLNI